MKDSESIKISIISASLNGFETLRTLARSITEQTHSNLEWIVQDGGSTDGTINFLRCIKDERVKLQSSTDLGIYDALNKAIKEASGEYILVLGLDDYLWSRDTLQMIAQRISCQKKRPELILAKTKSNKIFTSKIGLKTLILNSAHHQSTLYKKSLFDDFSYRTDIPEVADYELNLIAFLKKFESVTHPHLITECGLNGVSHTASEFQMYLDLHRIRKEYIWTPASFFFTAIGLTNFFLKRTSSFVRRRK